MRSRLNFVCYPKQAVQTLPQERKKKKKRKKKEKKKTESNSTPVVLLEGQENQEDGVSEMSATMKQNEGNYRTPLFYDHAQELF